MCLQAYGSVGRYDEAVQLFQSLQDPDMVAVSSILAMQDTVEGREDVSLSQTLHDLTGPVDSQLLNQLLIRRAEAGLLHVAILSQSRISVLTGTLWSTCGQCPVVTLLVLFVRSSAACVKGSDNMGGVLSAGFFDMKVLIDLL